MKTIVVAGACAYAAGLIVLAVVDQVINRRRQRARERRFVADCERLTKIADARRQRDAQRRHPSAEYPEAP